MDELKPRAKRMILSSRARNKRKVIKKLKDTLRERLYNRLHNQRVKLKKIKSKWKSSHTEE